MNAIRRPLHNNEEDIIETAHLITYIVLYS